MISIRDESAIAELAEHYRVKRVLVFGSGADSQREAHDIDLAVEGLPPEEFFRFYGDLIFALSKPVDLIDLSEDSKFHRLVRQEGVAVYVRPESHG